MEQWIQFAGVILTVLGGCAFLRREIKSEIKEIKDDAKAQAARTDRIYEMFCELRKDSDQKFYDLLKERK